MGADPGKGLLKERKAIEESIWRTDSKKHEAEQFRTH